MMTVFDRIPDWFVERYDSEICAWAANFSKIGPIKHIVLREGHLSDSSPDPEQGPVLLRVGLIAKMERLRDRVTIAPADEQSEMLIAKHCEKMQRLKVHPRMVLKEPPRPGLPFLPNIKVPEGTRH